MVRSWAAAIVTGLVLLGLAIAPPAQAADLLWDFKTGCTVDCGLDGPNGNTRVFTADDGSTTVTVSAWSRTANSATGTNDIFANAFLGQYSQGLGVTNRDEGDGSSGKHTLDNRGRLDLMAFFFNSTIIPTSALLTPFTTGGVGPDSDITAWIAQVGAMPDLSNNLSLTDIDTMFGPQIDNTGSGTRTAMFGDGTPGNLLLLAGNVTEFLDGLANGNKGGNDGVKIGTLGAKTPPNIQIPEPGTMATFAIGLISLGFMARRRNRGKQRPGIV